MSGIGPKFPTASGGWLVISTVAAMRRFPTGMRVYIAAVLSIGLASTMAGCGSANDKAAVRTAVEEYLDNLGEQNYSAACGFLTQQAQGTDCATRLAKVYADLSSALREDMDDISVNDVSLKGSSATVRDSQIRVEHQRKVTTTKNKKKTTKTTKSYTTLSDVTPGDGFAITKVGSAWKISTGQR